MKCYLSDNKRLCSLQLYLWPIRLKDQVAEIVLWRSFKIMLETDDLGEKFLDENALHLFVNERGNLPTCRPSQPFDFDSIWMLSLSSFMMDHLWWSNNLLPLMDCYGECNLLYYKRVIEFTTCTYLIWYWWAKTSENDGIRRMMM